MFANLPEWINRTWDYVVTGRDSDISGEFEQYMRVDGQELLVDQHPVAGYGRRTNTGFHRFDIRLER